MFFSQSRTHSTDGNANHRHKAFWMKGPKDLFLWFCKIVLKVSTRLRRSMKEGSQ